MVLELLPTLVLLLLVGIEDLRLSLSLGGDFDGGGATVARDRLPINHSEALECSHGKPGYTFAVR